jgi:RNA polymerase sigma factor for flagellar operon FliA
MGITRYESVEDAWQAYKVEGDMEARNDLVLHYLSLARYVASRVAAGLPSTIEFGDLVSYGTFGLIDAIDKFDLGRQVKFETYAIARIRGSIIDELRALDWVPRSVRSKARDVERAYAKLEAELGRTPEEEEVAKLLHISVPELWILLSQTAVTVIGTIDASIIEPHGDYSPVDVTDMSQNPEADFSTQEIQQLLADAVAVMPQRSKQIIALYYLEELTLAEIGTVLGVTESRVCQLQTKMIQSLRDALGQEQISA